MPQHSKGPRLYLRKRKDGQPTYIIRDGTRQVGTGCSAKESQRAREKLAEYLKETFRPDTSERHLASINCAEVLMLYAEDQPVDKPSLALIGYHMKALLPFWGAKSLADVKGSTCRGFLRYRSSSSAESKGVQPSTVRRELKTLQAAINHWHKESPLAAVPKVSLPPEAEPRERVLERSEVARMLWAARKLKLPHVARFILIGIYTGTRHDAILKLRWTDSLSGGHVDVDRGLIFRRGAAERETSKRRPPVQLGRRLQAHVAAWKREDARTDLSHVVHYAGLPILKMRRAWDHAVKVAGLGPDVTPHVLRHTCASWLLWQGRTIWDVAGVIGADASTVERVYGHHRRIDQQERARA